MANEYAIRYKLILGAVNYVQCTLNKIYTFNMWVKNVCSFYLFYHGRLGFCSCRDDVAIEKRSCHIVCFYWTVMIMTDNVPYDVTIYFHSSN